METALDGETFGKTLYGMLFTESHYADDICLPEDCPVKENAESTGSGDDQGRRNGTVNQCRKDDILLSRPHASTSMW